MLEGEFAVAGWYTNLVPSCIVLPLIDHGADREPFPFGGTLRVQGGEISGVIVDSTGKAVIEGSVQTARIHGITAPEWFRFNKRYLEGEMVSQPPVLYILEPAGSEPSEWRGGFRFSELQSGFDGEVAMFLHPTVFEREHIF